jgi:hypothetical protein
VIGEAMSLAATKLVLCMPGRTGTQIQPGKPEGSIHGAGVGVHGADAANAWRNIARVSNARNRHLGSGLGGRPDATPTLAHAGRACPAV